jgi:hypothetical protein
VWPAAAFRKADARAIVLPLIRAEDVGWLTRAFAC